MRVFLTGASGFVGSHVAEALVLRGHEVHALVLPGLAPPVGVARVVEGDLLDPSTYANALSALRPETCIHVAWYADPRDYLSARANLDLLGASTRLAATLLDLGCRRLVGVGTCFEYDTSLGWLSETSTLAPRHLYATCKRAVFDVVTRLAASSEMSFAWARLFYLYGPREAPGRLVPAVVDALLAGEEARVGTGVQIRDYLHVRDAAAAIVHVAEDASITGPINVASGQPVTVRSIVETTARVVGTRRGAASKVAWGAVPSRPDDPPFVCADVRKLAASGFVPTLDLEAGLADTIGWRAGGTA